MPPRKNSITNLYMLKLVLTKRLFQAPLHQDSQCVHLWLQRQINEQDSESVEIIQTSSLFNVFISDVVICSLSSVKFREIFKAIMKDKKKYVLNLKIQSH